MNTIEQALEVAERLRSLMGSWPLPQEAADTIDALIAELAALKGQEPVGEAVKNYGCGGSTFVRFSRELGIGEKVYLAAGAQPTIRNFRTVQDHIKTVDIVGWRWVATCGSGSYQLTDYEPMRGYSYKSPVYEVPPVQAQAQERKPLTEEQIMEIAKPFIRSVGGYTQHEDAIPDNGSIEDFARALEAAHDIK